ncbi:MAG TPA: maleylpyruvate isomerase N-terminal domain-containing protein [Candidatus Dormibacteraeota bacterium]|nr:maleylpyruvate isomerase N-terminal domain-containing protein [Candidatus Dormibacteraeota bacterium]
MRLEVDLSTLLGSLAGQLRRLTGSLEGLSAAEWRAPSRCSGWTVSDVTGHVCWGLEVSLEVLRRAARGSSERVFDGFDPRLSPDLALDAVRGRDPSAHLEALTAGATLVLAEARDLGARGLEAEADSPLGWVPWPLALNHLLWDAWLHERDILAGLGRDPAADPVEVRLVAAYQLVPLGGIMVRAGMPGLVDLRLEGVGGGAYRLRAGDELAVDHPGEPPSEEGCLRGDAVTVVEAISGRGDLAAAATGPEPMRQRARLLARRLSGV